MAREVGVLPEQSTRLSSMAEAVPPPAAQRPEIFPRGVRPAVFRALWLVLVLLFLVLTGLVVQFARLR
ncbi:hypothetical protein [Micromonospora sp. NPDC051296]|uniref:hypothetical protein n=1 Tax=Micromonospora sp. NPDC051296 TaxID=3155046 RepID=UPI00343E2D7A